MFILYAWMSVFVFLCGSSQLYLCVYFLEHTLTSVSQPCIPVVIVSVKRKHLQNPGAPRLWHCWHSDISAAVQVRVAVLLARLFWENKQVSRYFSKQMWKASIMHSLPNLAVHRWIKECFSISELWLFASNQEVYEFYFCVFNAQVALLHVDLSANT